MTDTTLDPNLGSDIEPAPVRADAPSEIRRGAAAMLPLLVGYAPFAFVVGAATASHATPAAGWAGIWLILGGSAHLATLRALDDGPAALALVTGLLVNARLIVYSASLSTAWRVQPRWFRAVGAALLIDPTWAAAQARAAEPGSPTDQRRYFLAAALTLSTGWCALITAGMFIGARWSDAFGLAVTAPLCLIALVGPRLLERGSRLTVVVAAAFAAATRGLPAGTGLLAAVAIATTVGVLSRAGTDSP